MKRARMLRRTASRRRSLSWALGLAAVGVACGTAPGSGQVTPVSGDARAAAALHTDERRSESRALTYLQEDYERIFPERVRLARYGEVRFAARDLGDAGGAGDRSDVIEMGEAPALVVVDQVRDRVRVIAQQDHYRLLLWIDADDLYTVLTEPVSLTPDSPGGSVAAGGAIRLHPGLPLEVDGERRNMAHIRHRDACVSLSGLVPRSAIGRQFVPIDTAEVTATALVSAGTAVLDHPGGRQVARFLADCDVVDTGPARDDHRPILYATRWLHLRGWVAGTAGKPGASVSSSPWGYGVGHLGLLLGPRSRFRLTEGTCLHARRGGPAVGIVTEDFDAPRSPAVNGWWPVPIETGWGDLTVWVAEEAPAAKPPEPKPDPEGDAESDAEGSGDDDDSGNSPDPPLRRCK
jgi:hypothetical protein